MLNGISVPNHWTSSLLNPRAENLATEIKDLQGQLADYNVVGHDYENIIIFTISLWFKIEILLWVMHALLEYVESFLANQIFIILFLSALILTL